MGVITPRIGPWTVGVSRTWPSGPTCRSTRSASTRSAGCWPPPAREGRVAWYGPEHLERLARIRELQAQGLTLALIGRVLSGDLDATDAPLAVAVADADAPEEFLSLAELAERSGSAAPPSSRPSRAKGCSCRASTTATERYTTGDVDVVRAGLALARDRLPALGSARARARAQRQRRTTSPSRPSRSSTATYARRCARRDLSDDDKAQRLVEAFRTLLPAVTALVEHHFRRVLLAVAQEHLESVGEDDELAAASVEAARQLETRASKSGAAT